MPSRPPTQKKTKKTKEAPRLLADRHLWFAAAVLFSVLAVVSKLGYDADTKEAFLAARGMAASLAGSYESVFEHAEGDLRSFVPLLQEEDFLRPIPPDRRARLERALSSNLRGFRAVGTYRVFDASGRALFGAGPKGPDAALDVSDRLWFQTLKASSGEGLAVSDAIKSKATGEDLMVVAVPVRSADGRFLGAVDAGLSLDFLRTRMDDLALGENGAAALRSSDTTKLLVRRPRQKEDADRAPAAEGFKEVADAARAAPSKMQEGVLFSPLDKTARVYAVKAMERYPFVVAAALAPADFRRRWALGTAAGLAACAASIFVLALFRRREAEAAELLRRSSARQSFMMKSASDGAHVLDASGRLVVCSDSFARMLGYDPEEMPGMPVSDWDASIPRDEIQSVLDGILREGRSFETRHRRKDGTEFDVEIAACGFELDGESHLYASARDVSERKRLHGEIQDGRNVLQALLDASHDAALLLSEDGTILVANKEASRRFETPHEELVGSDFFALFPPDLAATRGAECLKVLRSGLPRAFRDEHAGMILENNLHPVDPVEGAGRVALFSSDATARERAEAARADAEAGLKSALARLDLVLRTTAEGILMLDDEGRIAHATPSAAAALGWPSDESMLGALADEAVGHVLEDGSPCPQDVCRIRRAVSMGEFHRVSDEFFAKKDGSRIPVEYTAAPILVSGVPVGAVLAFHDMVAVKALEADLLRSNAELEQFAYVASHDLRQPLRTISGHLSLIKRRFVGVLDGDCADFLDFAVQGARRMDAMIVALLEYSRAGRGESREDVSLSQAASDAAENLALAVAESKGRILVAPDLPHVRADRFEMMRLFQNLLGNALKYKDPSRPPTVSVGFSQGRRTWDVWVEDDGAGIPQDSRERVFGIFQRLVGQEIEGAGIGLAVCRKIMEGIGGTIRIEDAASGPGCRFVLSFPKSSSPAAPAPASASSSAGGTP